MWAAFEGGISYICSGGDLLRWTVLIIAFALYVVSVCASPQISSFLFYS